MLKAAENRRRKGIEFIHVAPPNDVFTIGYIGKNGGSEHQKTANLAGNRLILTKTAAIPAQERQSKAKGDEPPMPQIRTDKEPHFRA